MNTRSTGWVSALSFGIFYSMSNSSGLSKMAGRLGSLLALLGVVAFFVGILGGPRTFAFAGVAMIVVSLASYFVEEVTASK